VAAAWNVMEYVVHSRLADIFARGQLLKAVDLVSRQPSIPEQSETWHTAIEVRDQQSLRCPVNVTRDYLQKH
jgi:hypothetical protein